MIAVVALEKEGFLLFFDRPAPEADDHRAPFSIERTRAGGHLPDPQLDDGDHLGLLHAYGVNDLPIIIRDRTFGARQIAGLRSRRTGIIYGVRGDTVVVGCRSTGSDLEVSH